MRPSLFLSAADLPQSVVSELSHDSLHTSQAVCDSVNFEDSCARWDQLGEALQVDWTLALAQDAIQQEEEQMAQMMYHQTSLQSRLFISNMSYSPAGLFFFFIPCHKVSFIYVFHTALTQIAHVH